MNYMYVFSQNSSVETLSPSRLALGGEASGGGGGGDKAEKRSWVPHDGLAPAPTHSAPGIGYLGSEL